MVSLSKWKWENFHPVLNSSPEPHFLGKYNGRVAVWLRSFRSEYGRHVTNKLPSLLGSHVLYLSGASGQQFDVGCRKGSKPEDQDTERLFYSSLSSMCSGNRVTESRRDRGTLGEGRTRPGSLVCVRGGTRVPPLPPRHLTVNATGSPSTSGSSTTPSEVTIWPPRT